MRLRCCRTARGGSFPGAVRGVLPRATGAPARWQNPGCRRVGGFAEESKARIGPLVPFPGRLPGPGIGPRCRAAVSGRVARAVPRGSGLAPGRGIDPDGEGVNAPGRGAGDVTARGRLAASYVPSNLPDAGFARIFSGRGHARGDVPGRGIREDT